MVAGGPIQLCWQHVICPGFVRIMLYPKELMVNMGIIAFNIGTVKIFVDFSTSFGKAQFVYNSTTAVHKHQLPVFRVFCICAFGHLPITKTQTAPALGAVWLVRRGLRLMRRWCLLVLPLGLYKNFAMPSTY